MGSWTCGICEWEACHPTKGPVIDHIREKHVETLIRASLSRSEKEPNRTLDGDVLKQAEA